MELLAESMEKVRTQLMRECCGYYNWDGKRLCESDAEDLISQVCEELLVKESRGNGYDSVYGRTPEQYITAYFRRRTKERFRKRNIDYVSTASDSDSLSAVEMAYSNAAEYDEYKLSDTSEIIKQCKDVCSSAGIEFRLLAACAERMNDSDLSAMGSLFAPLRVYAKKHSDVVSIIEDFLGLFSYPNFRMADYKEAAYA